MAVRIAGSARAAGVWTLRRAPGRSPHRGLLDTGMTVYPCVIGRSGISVLKREGDGATPCARLAVIGGYVRRDRLGPGRAYRGMAATRKNDGWCDDPSAAAYNRPVRLPFRWRHEKMWREDRLYDLCLILDWNVVCRTRNRGSAIFLHLAGQELNPTEGCIAVALPVMRRLLHRIRAGTAIRVLP